MTQSTTGTTGAQAAPGEQAIFAEQVTKSYPVGRDTIEILHGVSLSVRTGEMVAVMGPSGSGKSTLMYCLAGLEDATSGRIGLLGRDLARTSPTDRAKLRRTDVGFVFQSYNLLPTLTARQNVALPYLLRGQQAPDALIRDTLAAVGLADRMDARPSSMSGGEQQRTALARVLAQQPRIVFADEPTGALDTRSGELVLGELGRLAHEPGRCVLVVTHDPGVAARCDRVLFMHDGNLVRELGRAGPDQVAGVLASLSGQTS